MIAATIDGVPAHVGQDDADAVAASILSSCVGSGMRIAVAESLTGGLVADALVRVPGASQVVLGSAVTYDIAAKASVLGVERELLLDCGAVDPRVACQMARGAVRLYGQPDYGDTVIGVSTTGVAGPGPDGDKPAGLAYVGVYVPRVGGESVSRSYEVHVRGDRQQVRRGVVCCVLEIISGLTASFQE